MFENITVENQGEGTKARKGVNANLKDEAAKMTDLANRLRFGNFSLANTGIYPVDVSEQATSITPRNSSMQVSVYRSDSDGEIKQVSPKDDGLKTPLFKLNKTARFQDNSNLTRRIVTQNGEYHKPNMVSSAVSIALQ